MPPTHSAPRLSSMLALPDVTLCCVDTANQALALRALARSCNGMDLGRTLFLTDRQPEAAVAPAIEIALISPPLASRDAYSDFVLKSLLPYVTTSHVLLVQWDGYVTNPAAWEPVFLKCDYIGATWFWHKDGMRVGNGGFSLAARRLLEALQDPAIIRVDAEDTTIGRSFRPLLEREYGIRFATEALADRFSFEAAYPIGKPFGFHGLYNFCRTVPPDEIAALCPDVFRRDRAFAADCFNCCATVVRSVSGRRPLRSGVESLRRRRRRWRRRHCSKWHNAAPRQRQLPAAMIPARAAAARSSSIAMVRYPPPQHPLRQMRMLSLAPR